MSDFIEIMRISESYLRNEPCDICGRKAVTKRAEVRFDCGYSGELNICTGDQKSMEYRGKRIPAPSRDHFHLENDKTQTWFTLDEVMKWVRRKVVRGPNWDQSNGGKVWTYEVPHQTGRVIRHSVESATAQEAA